LRRNEGGKVRLLKNLKSGLKRKAEEGMGEFY
jgi:hypothetical protein